MNRCQYRLEESTYRRLVLAEVVAFNPVLQSTLDPAASLQMQAVAGLKRN